VQQNDLGSPLGEFLTERLRPPARLQVPCGDRVIGAPQPMQRACHVLTLERLGEQSSVIAHAAGSARRHPDRRRT
jgi:hypothetical protein